MHTFVCKKNFKLLMVSALTSLFVVAILSISASASDIEMPNLPVWDGSIAENYASGTGTKDDPYIISDGSHLALLAQEINSTEKESEQVTSGKYYKLTSDIVLNDLSDFNSWSEKAPKNVWTPGGGVFNYVNKGFAGYLDGNNYDVWGVYVNSNTLCSGLFGYIYGGQVKNLGVKYSYIKGTQSVGAITGYVRASGKVSYISGCRSENNVISGISQVGGICGFSEAYNKSVFIDKCTNSSEVTAREHSVGGICGRVGAYGVNYDEDSANYAASITNSINSGKISAKRDAGGIVGSSKDFVTAVSGSSKIALVIRYCVNNGEVSATTNDGAIIGLAGPEYDDSTGVITDLINNYGSSECIEKLYGSTKSTVNYSTSKLYTSQQMAQKDNFEGFDFDTVWNFVSNAEAPSLRRLGDMLNTGVVNGQSVVTAINILAGINSMDAENADFNGDGEFTLADLNGFMTYIKGKGATAEK